MSYFRPDVLFWKPFGETGHAHGPGDQKAKPEPRLPPELFLQDQDGEKNGQKDASTNDIVAEIEDHVDYYNNWRPQAGLGRRTRV